MNKVKNNEERVSALGLPHSARVHTLPPLYTHETRITTLLWILDRVRHGGISL